MSLSRKALASPVPRERSFASPRLDRAFSRDRRCPSPGIISQASLTLSRAFCETKRRRFDESGCYDHVESLERS
jgi:hypothetical protein